MAKAKQTNKEKIETAIKELSLKEKMSNTFKLGCYNKLINKLNADYIQEIINK